MIEEKLNSIGIRLSSPPQPIGSYVPLSQSGNLLFVSGQIPLSGGTVQASKQCTINALEQMNKFLGNLERISNFVKLSGYVNSDPSFKDHPKVINGASDLILEVFGERGKHTRVAIGVSSLPLDSVVEIEFLCEVN
jgi:enamine deaminase RidA (YjgF/YER057c/UK114 family)